MAVTGWSPEQKETFLRAQLLAQHRYYQDQYPDATFDIVEVAGQPAGRLYLWQNPTELHVLDIALLPEYRNSGLGSKLLRKIQARGKASGRPVSVYVERFNRALRLYHRLGFSVVEDQGVYLRMLWSPNSRRDAAAK